MTWCQVNASGPYVSLVVFTVALSLGLCDFGFLQLNCDCSLHIHSQLVTISPPAKHQFEWRFAGGPMVAQDYSGWVHSYHAIL